MGVKKIAPIPKQYSKDYVTLESSLASKGYYRNPGAYKTIVPFKGLNGKYLTGLDENAPHVQRLPREEREAEIKRIQEDRARLEAATGYDLSPTSRFFNYASNLPEGQKVTPVKLGTKDVVFNMDDPLQEIAWNWVKVHPNVAPSLQAVHRGDVNPQVVQYYVADDEVEAQLTFKRKVALNKAIARLDSLAPSKLRQVGRLLGLPITEDTKEEVAYNQIDTLLKSGEFATGKYKGQNPVSIFTELLDLSEQRAHVKDVVAEAIKTSIIRVKGNGRLFEGEVELASSEEAFVNYLLDDKNQEDLFALEKKLKINKITDIA